MTETEIRYLYVTEYERGCGRRPAGLLVFLGRPPGGLEDAVNYLHHTLEQELDEAGVLDRYCACGDTVHSGWLSEEMRARIPLGGCYKKSWLRWPESELTEFLSHVRA